MDAFAALADPLRRNLLLGLVGGSLRVVDMAAAHPVSRPAISRHLRLLSEAGLVRADDVGRERHYRLCVDPLTDVEELIARLASAPPVPESALDALATEIHRTKRERRLQEETA